MPKTKTTKITTNDTGKTYEMEAERGVRAMKGRVCASCAFYEWARHYCHAGNEYVDPDDCCPFFQQAEVGLTKQ
jgi:hypothetical protein